MNCPVVRIRRIRHWGRSPILPVLLFAFWGVPWLLGANCTFDPAGPQCVGCSPPPEPPALGTCLDTSTSVEFADSSRSYSYGSPSHGVDARGVEWTDHTGDAVETSGSGSPACWVGGRIDGPYEDSSVYECTSEHCPSGGCPSPCLDYHTTAAFAPETTGAVARVEGLYARDYGDGIGRQVDFRGHLILQGIYLEDMKDDAIEDDWLDSDTSLLDSVIDGAHIAFGDRLRGSANEPDGDAVWVVRDSLIRLRENVNTYKQRPGHGGIWKGNKDSTPHHRYRMTGNTFYAEEFEGGHVFPIHGWIDECEGNTLYYAGTASHWESVLSDGDGYADGLTDGERLDAIHGAFPGCFTVVVKPSGQSKADFKAQRWDPLVTAWRAAHPEVDR